MIMPARSHTFFGPEPKFGNRVYISGCHCTFRNDLSESILCMTLMRPVSTVNLLLFSSAVVLNHKQAERGLTANSKC